MNNNKKIVLIGMSAGGIKILQKIFAKIDNKYPFPIVIISHLGATHDNEIIAIIQKYLYLRVKEADDKELIMPGNVYVAPANYHLLIEEDYTFSLSVDEKVNYARPSIDLTFYSAGDVYSNKTIAVILTGANKDACKGAKYIKEKNGLVIVQDPATALMPTMPEAVLNSCKVDYVLTPNEIADKLNYLAMNYA